MFVIIGDPRVKWWNLTEENARKLSERIAKEGIWKQADDVHTTWEVMAECIQMSAKEALCISRRGGSKIKEVWWWNEEVKERVKDIKKRRMLLSLIVKRTKKRRLVELDIS